MEDYSERNLRIIEEAMQELGISDCEEIPEAIRLLKQKAVEQRVQRTAGMPCKKHGIDFCAECFPTTSRR